MTWGLARRTNGDGIAGGSLGFAAKMVGIGLCAGLALTSVQFVIDTLFRAVH
jgi:hypothetical protein